jgi:H+-transporting ATPase
MLELTILLRPLGWFRLRLDPDSMRSLTFLSLVLAGQITGLVLRTRNRIWRSRPAAVMLAATATAAALAWVFALMGWFMASLPGWLILSLFGGSFGYGLVLDSVKVAMLRRLPIDRR